MAGDSDWLRAWGRIIDLRSLYNGLLDRYYEEARRIGEVQSELARVRTSGDPFAVLRERDLLSQLDELRRSRDSIAAETRRVMNETRGYLVELRAVPSMAYIVAETTRALDAADAKLPR